MAHLASEAVSGGADEIAGVSQAQMDAYSTRTVQVHAKERELAHAGPM
jgi:hypothetical protein